MQIKVPDGIKNNPRALAEFVLGIKTRRMKIEEAAKELKAAEVEATGFMLQMLSATGQKHYAFEDIGTFTRKTKVMIGFPIAENGGKTAAVAWLSQCLERGVIGLEDLLEVQQSRVKTDTVQNIEEAVANYNMANPHDPIPDSPFNHYEEETLSSPRPKTTPNGA